MLDNEDSNLPVSIKPAEYHRQLRYWTQRTAIAAGGPPPTGLYDDNVWRRFHDVFARAVGTGAALANDDETS